jgi:hypothetical protein
MDYELTSYINPKWPERVYYKATFMNETYHHTDKAIVNTWLREKLLNNEYYIKKQRLTEKAIDAFYKK